MKVYYINLIIFDMLYSDHPTIPKEIDHYRSLIKDPNNKIILGGVYELWNHSKLNNLFALLQIQQDQPNVLLVLENLNAEFGITDINITNVIPYYTFLGWTHHSEQSGIPINQRLDKNKILFLMGKPHKKHRIGALYELYIRNAMTLCEWSFHYTESLEQFTRECLPIMTDSEYENFISSTIRKIDDCEPKFQPDSIDFSNTLFRNNTATYNKASVSLVSETFLNPNFHWATEKTWRVMHHQHPFVMIGYKNSYDWLEDQGFDTFQYAVKHKKDSLVGTEDDVIRMAVENVLHLLENVNSHKDQLIASVKHNYDNYIRLATKNSSLLDPAIEQRIFKFYVGADEITGVDAERIIHKFWHTP